MGRWQDKRGTDKMKNESLMVSGLEKLLKNQKIEKVVQYNKKELVIIFKSGRKLFVDSKDNLEFSVT